MYTSPQADDVLTPVSQALRSFLSVPIFQYLTHFSIVSVDPLYSQKYRFSTAPTSEETDLPPSAGPQATTETWHFQSSGKEPISSEKRAHL